MNINNISITSAITITETILMMILIRKETIVMINMVIKIRRAMMITEMITATITMKTN